MPFFMSNTMAHYHFITTWKLSAPLDKVWHEIKHAHHWPEWWKGVEKAEEVQQGIIGDFTFRSVLPYSLSFRGKVIAIEDMKRIESIAYGELDGTGIWSFSIEGNYTVVRYYWTVRTTKWWMNLLSPIARPAFEWNHHIIMRWGGEGLAQRLGCELVA